jgi:hypothetical protein
MAGSTADTMSAPSQLSFHHRDEEFDKIAFRKQE